MQAVVNMAYQKLTNKILSMNETLSDHLNELIHLKGVYLNAGDMLEPLAYKQIIISSLTSH